MNQLSYLLPYGRGSVVNSTNLAVTISELIKRTPSSLSPLRQNRTRFRGPFIDNAHNIVNHPKF
ncbi:hypothetical protein Lwal_0774 [Legionella waltersii]|uniref:Uncharacterized protein n=1 Tax=Legionella waltersii TaxID=66969 RepID=A0A0W1ALV1_9GAMM|nr:hypothetical protein Lwal_0774 [Legionella waltersii]SNV04189.1 Uncharacterised protein [Legionella waltersii]